MLGLASHVYCIAVFLCCFLRSGAFALEPPNSTDKLIDQASKLARAIAAALKRLEKSPKDPELRAELDRLQQELSTIDAALGAEQRRCLDHLKSEYGLDEEWLRQFEESQRPKFGKDYWNSEIQQVPSTVRLEDVVAAGLEQLLPAVDADWLKEQSLLRYRQKYDAVEDSNCRLHLVGRQRLLSTSAPRRPHRLANMLLTSTDLLAGRHDVDLFDGPMLVSEVAGLGAALPLIKELGSEATKKFNALPSMTERDVVSTVYELLVGAACLRMGRAIEMLPTSNEKTPDFRVHDLAVPMVVECKRREGLSKYAETEARHVERLYEAAAELFERHHPLIEVDFKTEAAAVSADDFSKHVELLCDSWDDDVREDTPWGTMTLRRLPILRRCTTTRVYSPAFLAEVFEWNQVDSDWDGLLCEIEPVKSPVVSEIRGARGLKWRYDSETARTKKARSLISLWGDAVRQIPTGEMGCVYISYTENMRTAHADARTQFLLDAIKKRDLFHRGTIRVPLTVISRLYPQALGNGALEMIESVIPMTQVDYDHMLGDFPTQVFHIEPMV